jgi:GTP cyclohydrolase I
VFPYIASNIEYNEMFPAAYFLYSIKNTLESARIDMYSWQQPFGALVIAPKNGDEVEHEKIEEAFKIIFQELGYDISDPDFQKTPYRVAKVWKEYANKADFSKHVVIFPSKYNQMIVQRGFKVFSKCPHHAEPILYNCVIGIVPDKHVLGLSKIVRITESIAKRFVKQEDLTEDIADRFMELLNPKGVGIFLEGKHGCEICRGIKQFEIECVTTALRGCFLKEPETRAEFMKYIK